MKSLTLFICALAAAVRITSAQDITTGLAAHYPMTETQGTRAAEVVSGSYATVIGNVEWANPGARFAGGGGDQLYMQNPPVNQPTTAGSMAVWIKPDNFSQKRAICGNANYGPPWRLWLDTSGRINLGHYDTTNIGDRRWTSNGSVASGVWSQVSVTFNQSAIKFYINGTLDTTLTAPPAMVISQAYSGSIGLGVYLSDSIEFLPSFLGVIRDLRYYTRVLDVADIQAIYKAMDPAYAGLWLGECELNEVKEAATGAWAAAPAMKERIILHVTSGGYASLYSEATLMKSRPAAPALPEPVVITRPELLANFDGITPRGGRLIGQRFSSAGFPFPPAGTLLASGPGGTFSATVALPAAAPANPFRHKYHPDLASGRALSRTISFTLPPADSPSDHLITGVLNESISGLHKTTLEARGPVTFTRVSTSGKINTP